MANVTVRINHQEFILFPENILIVANLLSRSSGERYGGDAFCVCPMFGLPVG
jgi:hypothetical protein